MQRTNRAYILPSIMTSQSFAEHYPVVMVYAYIRPLMPMYFYSPISTKQSITVHALLFLYHICR
jgi:hypothetical protein